MCTQTYTKTYALITHGLTIESMLKYNTPSVTPIIDQTDDHLRCYSCVYPDNDASYGMNMDGWVSMENSIDLALADHLKALVTVNFKSFFFLQIITLNHKNSSALRNSKPLGGSNSPGRQIS